MKSKLEAQNETPTADGENEIGLAARSPACRQSILREAVLLPSVFDAPRVTQVISQRRARRSSGIDRPTIQVSGWKGLPSDAGELSRMAIASREMIARTTIVAT